MTKACGNGSQEIMHDSNGLAVIFRDSETQKICLIASCLLGYI